MIKPSADQQALPEGELAWLIAESGLKPTRRLILSTYLSCARDKATAFPSLAYLSAKIGVCQRTACSHRKWLIDEGFLLVIERVNGRKLIAQINADRLLTAVRSRGLDAQGSGCGLPVPTRPALVEVPPPEPPQLPATVEAVPQPPATVEAAPQPAAPATTERSEPPLKVVPTARRMEPSLAPERLWDRLEAIRVSGIEHRHSHLKGKVTAVYMTRRQRAELVRIQSRYDDSTIQQLWRWYWWNTKDGLVTRLRDESNRGVEVLFNHTDAYIARAQSADTGRWAAWDEPNIVPKVTAGDYFNPEQQILLKYRVFRDAHERIRTDGGDWPEMKIWIGNRYNDPEIVIPIYQKRYKAEREAKAAKAEAAKAKAAKAKAQQ